MHEKPMVVVSCPKWEGAFTLHSWAFKPMLSNWTPLGWLRLIFDDLDALCNVCCIQVEDENWTSGI
jgi:hypothetical protein